MKQEHIEKLAKQMTDNILKAIENGQGAAWLKPWNDSYFGNILTGSYYRGFNPMVCGLYNAAHGYTTPHFITLNACFKMAKESGEKWNIDNTKQYLTICLARPFKKKVEKDGKEVEKTFFVYRLYNVYNIQQIEGWKEKFAEQIEKREGEQKEPIADAEQFISNYLENENITVQYGGSKAAYIPKKDSVVMPELNQFVNSEFYYSTFLHELAHSSGNENRLNRFKPTDSIIFGDTTYSVEELTAELTASMLMGELGIENGRTIQNTSEYLANWGRKFKENPTMIFNAAKDAARAAKYMKDSALEKTPA